MKNYFYIILLVIFCTSCSKEFKLFEDYKDITIAYGLVDIEDSVTYLRIEKAFLTWGDMYESALIADSNLFTYKLDVKLEIENTEIIFDTITIFNKKGGIFYAPKMQVYYAVTKDKIQGRDNIKLVIENPKTNETISSTTVAIDAYRLKIISPKRIIAFDPDEPEKLFIKFNTINSTRLYQVVMRLYYMEVNPKYPENRVYKHVDYDLEEVITRIEDGTEDIYIDYSLDSFLAALSNGISRTTELERYWADSMELSINTANEDFLAYQQSTSSDYSIIQYRKAYNNIDNGYGLFACKASRTKILPFDSIARGKIKNIDGLNFMGSIIVYNNTK